MIFAFRLNADRAIVAVELWIPLIREGAVESVPACKSPAQRPIMMRTGGAIVRDVGQMPFSDRVRGIAVSAKHFGVTWKFVYRTPFDASASIRGVEISEP